MAVIRQGGSRSLPEGTVMGTRGLIKGRAQPCQRCGSKENGNRTVNPNGQVVCIECANPRDRELLKGSCDPDTCACGQAKADESDPA
jgi:hypothetical protein